MYLQIDISTIHWRTYASDALQLTLTNVETSITVNNSPIQDYATIPFKIFFELAFSHFAPLKGHIVRSLEWTHLQNFKNNLKSSELDACHARPSAVFRNLVHSLPRGQV